MSAAATPVASRATTLLWAVREHPGIHFRALGRVARIHSTGQLRHHLDRLNRKGLIVEVADGRYRRYFISTDAQPGYRAELGRLARPMRRRIAELLLERPMRRTQLRRALRCADSTLGYHLDSMLRTGDVRRNDGPGPNYALADCDLVRTVLRVAAPATATRDEQPDASPTLPPWPIPGAPPRTERSLASAQDGESTDIVAVENTAS